METSQIKLRITVKNVSQLGLYNSPVFNIRGITWHLVVKKCNENLAVCLACKNQETVLNWSCMAHLKCNLLTNSCNSLDRCFQQPMEYSTKNISWGWNNYLTIKELFDDEKNYVKNDSIVFEIKVKVGPICGSKLMSPIGLNELADVSKKTFRLTINKISELVGFNSPVVLMRGLPWIIVVCKCKPAKTTWLCLYLKCIYASDTDWSCEAKALFRLISEKRNKKQYKWMLDDVTFNKNAIQHGNREFIKWDDLVDDSNQYINNDSIELEVELEVQQEKGIALTHEEDGVKALRLAMQCPICFQSFIGRSTSSTSCGHLFCKSCVEKAVQRSDTCPVCNQNLDLAEIRPIYL